MKTKDEDKRSRELAQQRWNREFAAADKKFRKWHKEAKRVNDIFLGKDITDDTAYGDYQKKLNLFNSNVVTLMSMLYGNTPKVEIDRTFSDPKDDVARVAALMATRIIQQDIQNAGENLKTILRAALQDRLLGGLGCVRVRYDYEAEIIEHPAEYHPVTNELLVEAFTEEVIKNERVEEVYTHWKDIKWSPARTYNEIRWKAYRSYMTEEELVKRFGEDIAKKIPRTSSGPTETKKSATDCGEAELQAEIWEIWSKPDRKIFWYCEGMDEIIEEQDDFLNLDGFWCDPPPLIANVTTLEFMPRSDYALAQDLYQEIDKLQTRISLLTDAAKAVGTYDKSEPALGRIFTEAVENDLIPVENWAKFAEKGGIDGAISWLPLDAIVEAINVLTVKLNEKIQQLYQVTGMSDLMRGASQPYEAAATSRAKVQFASIRIQALQDEFARFTSDLQSLKLEIIRKHFTEDCIRRQSAIDFTDTAQTPNGQALIEAAIGFLKDPEQVKWRITIRPETLAMADYAQLKADRTDYLMAVATFLQSSASLAQMDKNIVPVLLKMLQWGLAGFKGSKDIESVLDEAIDLYTKIAAQPEPPKPDSELIKAQAKMQEIQMKIQADIQKHQMEIQQDRERHQMEMQQRQAEFQLHMQQMAAEFELKMRQMQMEMEAKVREQQAQFVYNTQQRAVEAAIAREEREHTAQTNREERSHAAAVQMVSNSEKTKADRGVSGGGGGGIGQSSDSDA
jgi:hypothetical protein